MRQSVVTVDRIIDKIVYITTSIEDITMLIAEISGREDSDKCTETLFRQQQYLEKQLYAKKILESLLDFDSEEKILTETFPASMIINNRIDNSMMVDDSKMVGRKINELIRLGYTVEIAGGTEDDTFMHLTLDRPGYIWRNEAVNVSIMTDGDNPDRQILYTLQKMQEAIESSGK